MVLGYLLSSLSSVLTNSINVVHNSNNMSNDESSATVSNQDDANMQVKPRTPEQWEIDVIGNFLLSLYHRLIITAKQDWCIKKSETRERFLQFVDSEMLEKLKNVNGTDNIGTLLDRCGFLINTTRGSLLYKIRYSKLFDFRNSKLKEFDYLQINNDDLKIGEENFEDLNNMHSDSVGFEEDNFEIDEIEPIISLDYEGTTAQTRKEDFYSTNMSCHICQENFFSMESFEEHIQIHGDDKDFEFSNTLDKLDSPIFNMSYRLCKNSHYFCFELETASKNIIIDKIIIVQSRSFFYVHNMRVPYRHPENGSDRFFVDSHLFTILLEQPIVLIFHLDDDEDFRIIEEHHFMRSEEFPKVNFPINPTRLPNKKLFTPKFDLADYFPPKEIQDALKDDFYHETLMKTSNEFSDYIRNDKTLQPHNIGASLNILLQIEDVDTIKDYLSLTQKNVKIRSCGGEYSLKINKQRTSVENLLSAYDEIILTTRTDIMKNTNEIIKLIMQNKSDIKNMNNAYVGVIQTINNGRISFKCNKKFNIHGSYTLICRPSRLILRYQYRSLELLPRNVEFLKKFLFPAKLPYIPLSTKSLTLYNENVCGEQLQAVRNIAEGPRNDATYIIFGPPGTGKTTTLVEAILQILNKPYTKILVSASSNSACDEIALRLCQYLKKRDDTRVMVRIYSRSCEIRTETINDDLLENSNMYNTQFYPDIDILHQYRIVICTLSVVAKLATGKFGRNAVGGGVYTHLFIDEVAASTEIESLMAITTILTPQSSLIISGDHKQLGPILQSKRAKELGLDVSLMDRLLLRECYRVDNDTGEYDRTIQTRLVRNYRSHPAIVNLYSGLYYNHSLESCAKQDISLGEIWHKSRNPKYPILFHAIYEHSLSDRNSHSLYNLMELQVVMDYLKDLMYFGINGEPIKQSDIGIISPYKRQYKRIQEELNLRKWFSIETGSVETFQGKEKSIIIVSFVRSGTENLGFLDNPRRLNVMLSRPKSLLILIGNPKTLSLNKDFEKVIKECQRNNTFIGSSRSSRGDLRKQQPNAAKEFLQLNKKMQDLKLENTDQQKADEVSHKSRRRRRYNRKNINFRSNTAEDGINEDNDETKDDDDESHNNDEPNTMKLNSMTHQQKVSEISQNSLPNRSRRNNTEKPNNKNSVKIGNGEDDGAEHNVDNDNCNSYTSEKNSDSKKNSRKGFQTRQSKRNVSGNGGKVSKQHDTFRKKNTTNINKSPNKDVLDSIFNALPQVPSNAIPSAPTAPTSTIYTKEQLMQLEHQKKFYHKLHHNQPSHQGNNFAIPADPYRQPPFNPYITQQQPHFNTFKQYNYAPQFPLAHNSISVNNSNLSCFNNVSVPHNYINNFQRGVNNSNVNIQNKSYDISYNARPHTTQSTTTRKDNLGENNLTLGSRKSPQIAANFDSISPIANAHIGNSFTDRKQNNINFAALNSNTPSKSASIDKPYQNTECTTTSFNETTKIQKSPQLAETTIMASHKTLANTSNNEANTSILNHGEKKCTTSANVYPTLRDSLTPFTTESITGSYNTRPIVTISDNATNKTTSSYQNKPANSLAGRDPLSKIDTVPSSHTNTKVSTNSHTVASNSQSNTYNFVGPVLTESSSVSNLNSNKTQPYVHKAYEAEERTTRPNRALNFSESKTNKKQESSCTIS